MPSIEFDTTRLTPYKELICIRNMFVINRNKYKRAVIIKFDEWLKLKTLIENQIVIESFWITHNIINTSMY